MRTKIIAFITTGLIILSVTALISKRLGNNQVSNDPVSLPNITLTRLDSTQTTLHTFANETPLLLVLVNSECAICHQQVDELYKRGRKLEDIQIILISHQELVDIQEFADQYADASFIFGQVDLHILNEHFGEFSTPHSFLYDKDHLLIKGLKGVNRVVHLKKYFEKNNL